LDAILKRLLVLFLVFAVPAFAQRTVVSGTVTDLNGSPYSQASLTITLSLPTGAIGAYLGGAQIAGTVGPVKLDNTGSFLVQLADNTLIQCANAAGQLVACVPQSTWNFSITLSPGVPPPLGTGPQTCSATLTISGASQSVSSNFNSCPALSTVSGGGGGASPIPHNGLTADYQMKATDTACTLTDYSGSGNNATGCVGVAPTIIAATGGVQFNTNGAISLPATLNASLSMLFFFTFQGSGNPSNYNAFVDGSTAGGANVTRVALSNFADATSGMAAPLANNYRLRAISNTFDTFISGPLDVFNGTFCVVLTMATSNHLYINGFEVGDYGSNTVFSSAGFMTTGNYQLGGNGTNSSFYTGQMYRASFWNRVLSAKEVQNACISTQVTELQKGIPLSTGPNFISNNGRLFYFGDSITCGFGLTTFWTSILALNGADNFAGLPNQRQQCVQGEHSFDFSQSQQTSVLPLFVPNSRSRDMAVFWVGTNDQPGVGAFDTLVNNVSLCKTAKAYGVYKVGITTQLSRGSGGDVFKNSTNPLFRNEAGVGCDFIVDLGGTTQLGADGANATAAFQADHLHPTQGSADNIVAYLQSRAANRQMGNRNYSTANTYTTGSAGLSSATTAGSQSGNVMSITLTSTAFMGTHNQQQLTCTGITPAGYNGSWFPLTNVANVFTAFNDTTGLGAITVQGSCSVPEQLDEDQYMILNAGAVTVTLQSCQALVGVPDRIYLKNINAAATTVAAFAGSANWSAENIDGAASVSVASGAELVLEPQLVSQAAAGCFWKKIKNN
jgi:hypothetical protein